MSDINTTMMVQKWLIPLQNPDSDEGRKARDQLIQHTHHRLELLCRKMFFKSFKATGVVDWEDVFQESALKLWKALSDAKPDSVRKYFGLATKKIQEVSIDMCRKFVREIPELSDGNASYSPVTATMWTEFHDQVGKLDPILRESFELWWYHDLTHKEIAEILDVDESTVKTRCRKARVALAEFVV